LQYNNNKEARKAKKIKIGGVDFPPSNKEISYYDILASKISVVAHDGARVFSFCFDHVALEIDNTAEDAAMPECFHLKEEQGLNE
jgi:hypothetical protein